MAPPAPARGPPGGGPEVRALARRPHRAGIRDPKALEALPESERAAWRELWAKVDAAKVDALLAQARPAAPELPADPFERPEAPASGPNPDPIAGTRAMLLAWARKAEAIAPPLPSDLAENHDHYAHGKPRE